MINHSDTAGTAKVKRNTHGERGGRGEMLFGFSSMFPVVKAVVFVFRRARRVAVVKVFS